LQRQLHARGPLLPRTADKLAVRRYVAERVGEDRLVPLLAVVDDPRALDLDALPPTFVVKATHGSGAVLIVDARARLDWSAHVKEMEAWLRHDWSRHEWVYAGIPRRLVVEAFLDEDGRPPPDYQLYVFSGVVWMIQVDVDRFVDHRRDLFDRGWRRLDIRYRYPRSGAPLPRPGRLEEMITVAETLGRDFPFVRVDLYEYRDRVLFGELTHITEAATGRFQPASFDAALGDVWRAGIPIPERYVQEG